MKNRLDSPSMHTKHKDAPTTNSAIELSHRHAMAEKNENAKPSRVLKERWNLKECGGTKDAYPDGSKNMKFPCRYNCRPI